MSIQSAPTFVTVCFVKYFPIKTFRRRPLREKEQSSTLDNIVPVIHIVVYDSAEAQASNMKFKSPKIGREPFSKAVFVVSPRSFPNPFNSASTGTVMSRCYYILFFLPNALLFLCFSLLQAISVIKKKCFVGDCA